MDRGTAYGGTWRRDKSTLSASNKATTETPDSSDT